MHGVKSDEIREVTQLRSNLVDIKSDISVSVDVFNRKFVTQFPKVALDNSVDLSTYCPTRKFYSDLHCLETYSISVQNTYIFNFEPKFTDFRFPCWTLHCQSNYRALWLLCKEAEL